MAKKQTTKSKTTSSTSKTASASKTGKKTAKTAKSAKSAASSTKKAAASKTAPKTKKTVKKTTKVAASKSRSTKAAPAAKTVKKTVKKATTKKTTRPAAKTAKTASKSAKTVATVTKKTKKTTKSSTFKTRSSDGNNPFKIGYNKSAIDLDREPLTEEQLRKVKTGLSKKDLKQFTTLLLLKRAELNGDVESLRADAKNAGANISYEHMADTGSDNYEQEFTLGLVESERRLLNEIDEALLRIERGYYGVCIETGEPINRERLEAKPWAKYCIEVAREKERHAAPRFRA